MLNKSVLNRYNDVSVEVLSNKLSAVRKTFINYFFNLINSILINRKCILNAFKCLKYTYSFPNGTTCVEFGVE